MNEEPRASSTAKATYATAASRASEIAPAAWPDQLGPFHILAEGFFGERFAQGQPFELVDLGLIQGADAQVSLATETILTV
jgi:hypothetical protein